MLSSLAMVSAADPHLVSWAGRSLPIRGAILTAWRAASGWHPLGEERATAGGVVQHFVQAETGALATICAHPVAGTEWVMGAIRDKWYEVGAELGRLGWPREPARATLDPGGAIQRFGGDAPTGAIASHPARGTYLIHADLHDTWLAAGGERALGLPECDTMLCGDGRGRYIQYARAPVEAAPSGLRVARTRIYGHVRHGVHVVADPILAAWRGTDCERGPLGYPTAAVQADGDPGGMKMQFEHGAICVSPTGEVRFDRDA